MSGDPLVDTAHAANLRAILEMSRRGEGPALPPAWMTVIDMAQAAIMAAAEGWDELAKARVALGLALVARPGWSHKVFRPGAYAPDCHGYVVCAYPLLDDGARGLGPDEAAAIRDVLAKLPPPLAGASP